MPKIMCKKWSNRLKAPELSSKLLPSIKQIGTICFAILISIFSVSSFADNITTSPADCTQPTLATDTGTANLTAEWEANTIGISWYNDGQKITGDANAATQCTYDHTFSLPTQPTKTGYTFTGWTVKAAIPAEYTQLEYLQSTGTQYIDTSVVGRTGVSVEASFQLSNLDNGSLFGNRMTGSTRFWPAMWYSSKWNSTIATDSYNRAPAIAANTMYTTYFVSNSSGWTFDVNGSRILSGTQTVDNTNNLWMFGTNNGALQYPFKGKAYWAKIWNNGTLVRKFIPVRRNSDNVLGMYDMVSGTFFTNAGTGTFTAGPEAQ